LIHSSILWLIFSFLLQLSDWYAIDIQEVERTKQGRALAKHHSSFPGALQSLFPDFDWDPSRFNTAKSLLLSPPSREVRTRLLERIAQGLGIKQV